VVPGVCQSELTKVMVFWLENWENEAGRRRQEWLVAVIHFILLEGTTGGQKPRLWPFPSLSKTKNIEKHDYQESRACAIGF
jgi:hypothetical protein